MGWGGGDLVLSQAGMPDLLTPPKEGLTTSEEYMGGGKEDMRGWEKGEGTGVGMENEKIFNKKK